MNIKNNRKGSMTVEASLVLPIFICVIISIAFLIKLVYVHEVMQHAISETANEMGTYSYLYHVTGIQDGHDEIRDGLKSQSELFKGHLSTIIDSYNDLGNFDGQNLKKAAESMEQATENPLEELKSIVSTIASGAFSDINTEVCIPIVKLYFNKYIKTDQISSADKRLRGLNIVGGFNGLDFSQSNFFEDENNDIDIIIRYKVYMPTPLRVFPPIYMVQRATAKAWLGGDDLGGMDEDDIWSLGNLQRGKRIQEIFGANLPSTFPVISSFYPDSGTALLIKSMDLTAASYQNKREVARCIEDYIKRLEQFNGQEQPWGKQGIVISRNQIKAKELLLVIPKNPISPEIQEVLDECIKRAAALSITLKIEGYGVKKLKSDEIPQNNSSGQNE